MKHSIFAISFALLACGALLQAQIYRLRADAAVRHRRC